MSGPLWAGRFESPPDAAMTRLTSSIAVDMRLLEQDLAATRAHARTLAAADLLTREDVADIDAACAGIATAWRAGDLKISNDDEDVHSLVERELTERIGETGSRIHAGRSRNDLVACDLRLWCKGTARALASQVGDLIGALLARAEEHTHTVMPGYTHLQRAQPITLAYHLLAHAFALVRDLDRFAAASDAADVSPLGAGALAGTTLDLDVSIAARELSFARVFDNAMDAVADRDFAADLIYACAMCGVHLSRLAEEIVTWCSAEWGFAGLPDEWSTGSSMMPQKRNPDLAELVRGRSAVTLAQLTGILALLKGLPLAYDRDLQEDKGFVFAASDVTSGCLAGARELVAHLEFDVERMEKAAGESATWATDVAETLVARGMPFRDAHRATGAAVAARERDPEAADAVPGPIEAPGIGVEEVRPPRPQDSVAARKSHGGPAGERVVEQIATLREVLTRRGQAGPVG